MKCESCGSEFPNPVSQAGGSVGGRAKVSKGFSSPAVQLKAMLARGFNWAGVYTLTDPRTGNVFWVGIAKNPAKRRFEHYSKAHLNLVHNQKLDCHLLEMRSQGAYPVETVVAAGPREQMLDVERKVIHEEAAKGSPLFNIQKTGKGHK